MNNLFQNQESNQEKSYFSQWKAIFSFILELIKIVIISLAIIIPIRAYVAQPFYVEGASMEPNFYDNEYLIVNEFSYHFSDPRRGEVVIFRPPNNYKVYYIKRIIGLPGETVEIKGNQIIIYNSENPAGFILDESKYLAAKTYNLVDDKIYSPLASDEYFVLGDNRPNSLDSRKIGPIQRQQIRGQVFLRAFPFNRFTIFLNDNKVN